jgi:hypothetical protein
MSWRRRCWRKRSAIDPNYGQALGVLATSHTFSAHMGWEDMADSVPDRRARRAGGDRWPTARTPGRTTRLGCVYLFTRRFDDSLAEFEWRCGSIPISRWRKAITAWRFVLLRALAGGLTRPRNARLRLSPRDPFSAVYCGIAAYAQFVGRNYHEAMRLAREAVRQRADFVGAHRVLDRRRRHGRPDRYRQGRIAGVAPRAAQYFAWPGSPARCRSKWRPNASTIWKPSGAPAWISLLAF